MNQIQRDEILKIMMNLEMAHDSLSGTKQCYKRDTAVQLIENAHGAVSKLLIEN